MSEQFPPMNHNCVDVQIFLKKFLNSLHMHREPVSVIVLPLDLFLKTVMNEEMIKKTILQFL